MVKLLERGVKLSGTIAWILAAVLVAATIVTWLAARDAITFVAPIIMYALAGCAILAAVIATATFMIERSTWIGTRWAELSRDRTLATNEARMSDLETERAQIHLHVEARYHAATLRQIERGLIHPATLGDGKFSAFPAAVAKHIDQGAVPLLEAPAQPLLPAIRNCDNVLIVGGKGSGKTTLLQHLEAERLQSGKTIILDSHAQPAQWAGQLVGLGRQYQNIKRAMMALTDKLNNRYQRWATGQSDFEPIHTVIDEFTLLPKSLKSVGYDIQEYSIPALTEGRKVAINCLWGIHSDRAKALGLEGATDLKECFDAIIYLKNVDGNRYALIDFGEGKQDMKYTHPGPFVRPGQAPAPAALPSVTETVTDTMPPLTFVVGPEPEPTRPTAEEMTAIEAFVNVRDSGNKFYWKDATEAAFGKGKFGKNYTNKLRRILKKFGVDYSKYEVK